MKKLLLFNTLLLASTLILSGCGKQQVNSSEATKTITYESESYQVPSQPQKIVSLSNSLLQMLYAVDGKAIARVETTDSLPENQQKLPTVGHTSSVNMESLLSLKPDLVIGLKNQHSKLENVMKSNAIPYVLINYEGIKDNIPLLEFLGHLTNHEDKAKSVITDYTNRMETVKKKAHTVTPAKVAVLRATGKSVTAETEQSITASMVKELGMVNVVTSHPELKQDAKTVPYSLEALAMDDPEIIFIVTMGKEEEIMKTMAKEMTNNPAWNQLKAVRSNKVFYLSSQRFLLNPGLETPEAMAELVQKAYQL